MIRWGFFQVKPNGRITLIHFVLQHEVWPKTTATGSIALIGFLFHMSVTQSSSTKPLI